EAPSHLAVFADRGTATGRGLGRRTMPEMAEYSVVAAMTAMWLAARAEGIGMGWGSILDPIRGQAVLRGAEAGRFLRLFRPRLSGSRARLSRARAGRMGAAPSCRRFRAAALD